MSPNSSFLLKLMSGVYDVCIAHFGHPLLRGDKHWALVILTQPHEHEGVAYQVSGSTHSYEVKEPEEIRLLSVKEYMGRVKVGEVSLTSEGVRETVQTTPVIRGDCKWNCQNWVVEALIRLRDAGHNIQLADLNSLRVRLAHVKRES